ncbi:MAG: 16S rRNA (guanine(966)-N(2))-methyltransferase RsmD [Simkaniaceae bacterium]|nr:16S rRNA (guanine(966)-N(2))-methyltransferase RsmD [Simkaniaceae bacterium]
MRITGGYLKNQKIKVPKTDATRPTSEKLRQSVFNICQHIVEEAEFLDLFAGSGAMGIEAISRGAKKATFIEKNPQALKALKENLSHLELEKVSSLYRADVLTYLPKLKGKSYELIYIDPPYEKNLSLEALVLVDDLNLLGEGGMLFLEESQGCDLSFPPLSHLSLKKRRKVGSTFLYEFIGAP